MKKSSFVIGILIATNLFTGYLYISQDMPLGSPLDTVDSISISKEKALRGNFNIEQKKDSESCRSLNGQKGALQAFQVHQDKIASLYYDFVIFDKETLERSLTLLNQEIRERCN